MLLKIRFIIIVTFLMTSNACKHSPIVNKPLFTKMPSETTQIKFENTIVNTEELNIFKYRNFYNGGGVGIGDINNDGLADVVLTANQGDNKVFLNKGDFKFQDLSESSGLSGKNKWSTGVVMVDLNADGWLDIYVCSAGNVSGDNQKNELYINNQDLTFTEAAAEYGLDDNGFTTHAAFFDYDNDGDLDVYLLNNSFVPVNSLGYSNKRELRSEDWKVKEILKGGGDKFLRNDNNHFVDVSEQAGIYGSLIGFGLGITVGDINNDQWQDIYVSNDFYERDYLYINQKDGTFSEEIEAWAPHISLSSMGADLSDINNDGHPDVFVTDMLVEDLTRLKETSEFERYDLFKLKQSKGFHNQYMQNTLQLNNGNQSFSEIAYYSGVAMTDWSWSALLFDMDNDGHKDIFVSNGIYHDLTNQDFMDFFADKVIDKMAQTGKKVGMDTIVGKMPSTPISNYAFKNNGNLTFSNAVKPWGFETPSFSNGTAYGDLDNDGDLDLIVNNVNQPTFVYRNEANETSGNTYLQLRLKGKGKNTYGIGSTINAYFGNEIIHQQVQPSRGFQSSVDYILTIGTGSQTKIDSLVIHWSDNSRQMYKEVSTNQLLVLDQEDAIETIPKSISTATTTLLKEQTQVALLSQEENDYVDFDYEGMIHKMLSKEGPSIAVGDINGDKKDDLFIGAPQGQAGQIYLHSANGFVRQESPALDDDLNKEDTASAFLDANGDGYLDLIVGSGGNQVDDAKTNCNLRLYLNDKKGNLKMSTLEMPKNSYNTAAIALYDFDQDGDEDVFVGSRSVPGMYGINPKHLLLENDGKGNFRNILKEKASQIQQVGMITSALWEDIDGDRIDDLIITEDWGAVHVFINKNGSLVLLDTNLKNLNGWWSSCSAGDIDNDGDVDLVLGNRGQNTIYKADSVNTLRMFINDFDNNGDLEQIFTTMVNGKDVPVHLKREMTGQLPILKKKNLKFTEYAHNSISDLFPENKLKRAIRKSINISESIVALNMGDNSFNIRKLPAQAQFSCINDIVLLDLNADRNLDIVFGGNDYSLKPQFSQLDASHGGVLLGDGHGGFSWVDYKDSGFYVNGVVNTVKAFESEKDRTNIIVGINDKTPLIYTTPAYDE